MALTPFPVEHLTRIYSTNPLERLNKEIKRRINVVGIFPNAPAVERLTGAVFLEINDEWQVERRYFSLGSMQKLFAPETLLPTEPLPLRLAPVH